MFLGRAGRPRRLDAAMMVHPPAPTWSDGRDHSPPAASSTTRARQPRRRLPARGPQHADAAVSARRRDALRRHIRPDEAAAAASPTAAGSRTWFRAWAQRTDSAVADPEVAVKVKPRSRRVMEAGAAPPGAAARSAGSSPAYADMLDAAPIVAAYAANADAHRARAHEPATRHSRWSDQPTWATSATTVPSIRPMIACRRRTC